MTIGEAENTSQDVREILIAELAAILECSPGEVDLSMRVTDLPGIDSLKLVQVVVACEQHWGIEFDEEALFDVRTGEDLCTLVCEALGAEVSRP